MNSDSYERIKGLVADLFDIPKEQVTLQTSPSTIDTWDSLKHLDLILALEQEFALQISPDEMAEMSSVEIITKVIEEKLAA
jgi:acyl carrier protein